MVRAAAAIILALQAATALSAEVPLAVATLVEKHCSECHDGHVEPSGTYVASFDAAHIADDAKLWSKAARHLRAGTMPPVGADRPEPRAIKDALTAIEDKLGTALPGTDTSQAIASRLAALLWNTAPDQALMRAAERDTLRDQKTLEREVRRMLADPRADSFVTRFFVPWLQLDKLAQATSNKNFFPDHDHSLREALRRETELFVLSQLRDDRDPLELWTADYTYLNEQIANHYRIAGVTGANFRRVILRTPERAGLLGQGSIMMATAGFQQSPANFTSPATRSRWILSRFLGVSAPAAFPGAQPIRTDIPIAGQTRQLPQDPCVNCHRNFFPLGYGLENLDPLGRWRTADQIAPIDASGALVDGTPFNGPVELRRALMQRPDAFLTTITERLLIYAAGGDPAKQEGTPQTWAIARQILRGNNEPTWTDLVAAVASIKPIALN
jgi:hypothetical protein